MRTALALLAVLLLAGCGGSGPLELLAADPPAGAEAQGKENERQGGPDPDAGEAIYTLAPTEGAELEYTVSVRNTSDEPVASPAWWPTRTATARSCPRRSRARRSRSPRARAADLVIGGHVRGCRFGGQKVAIAGPELKYAGDGSQELDLGIQVELEPARCGG